MCSFRGTSALEAPMWWHLIMSMPFDYFLSGFSNHSSRPSNLSNNYWTNLTKESWCSSMFPNSILNSKQSDILVLIDNVLSSTSAHFKCNSSCEVDVRVRSDAFPNPRLPLSRWTRELWLLYSNNKQEAADKMEKIQIIT